MNRFITAALGVAALAGLAGCTAAAEAAPAPAPSVAATTAAEETPEDELLAEAQKFADAMSAGDKETAKLYLAESSCTGLGPSLTMLLDAHFARVEAEELGGTWQVDGVNVWNTERGVVTGYSIDLPPEADRDRLTWPHLFGDGDDPEVWVKEDGAWFVDCGDGS